MVVYYEAQIDNPWAMLFLVAVWSGFPGSTQRNSEVLSHHYGNIASLSLLESISVSFYFFLFSYKGIYKGPIFFPTLRGSLETEAEAELYVESGLLFTILLACF